MTTTGAPYRYDVTLRLSATDAAGVLFFAEQLRLCHEAYEAMLDEGGVSVASILAERPWAVPIVRAETDLKRPVHVGDRLTILVRPTLPDADAGSSFSLAYSVEREGNVVGSSTTVHVCIDKATGRPRAVPPELREALAPFSSDS